MNKMEKPFLLMNDNDIFVYLFWADIYLGLTDEKVKGVLKSLWIDKNTTRRYLLYKSEKLYWVKKHLKHLVYWV
jgi:hypothetical protein